MLVVLIGAIIGDADIEVVEVIEEVVVDEFDD
jgi:hypothetical protein